jgi:hypothetical protein
MTGMETRSTVVGLRDGAPFAIAVFLVVRATLSLVAILTVRDASPPASAASGLETAAVPGVHNAIDGTNRWDALWFERIAERGYAPLDADAAFFPAYPLAIHALDVASPLGTFGSALFVSDAAFLGALIVLYALTARERSVESARKTIVLTACFPASFFFLAPYSESLFLLLAAATFWWVRAGRWPAGAAAAFGAALTRSVGVLLVPALLIEAWGSRLDRPSRIAWSLTPLLAPLAYGLYWWRRTGDLLWPVHVQSAWGRTFSFAPVTLARGIWLGISGLFGSSSIFLTADLLLTLLLVVPLVLAWRSVPPVYLAYAGATILVFLSYPLASRPLLSDPRFLLVVFPAFWALGERLRGPIYPVTVALFLIGYVAMSSAFMNWAFVF